MSADDILAWIDANPEGFTRIVVRKGGHRKVWWRSCEGRDFDTLRECIASVIKLCSKR